MLNLPSCGTAHGKDISGRRIARNYILESVGLEAVAYCEKMVAPLDLYDLQQAHDLAIKATCIKFAKNLPAL